MTLTSRAFRNDQLPLLCKELHELTGFEMALPMNSGAEAVETAVKAARKWGYKVKGIPEGKAEIIVCANNFHGRTVDYRQLLERRAVSRRLWSVHTGLQDHSVRRCEGAARAITPNTCAFLVEPIQGEAGIVMPPAGFLKEAEEICRENRVLFMCDEIQSGLGRTGKLFAYMHEDVTAGCADRRQGAVRRLLSCVGGAGVEGSAGRVQAGRSRQHVRRQSAGLCRRSQRRCVCWWKKNWSSASAELGAYFLEQAAEPCEART